MAKRKRITVKPAPPDDPMFHGGVGIGTPLAALLPPKAERKLKPETAGKFNELPDPNQDYEQWPPWDAIGDGDPMEWLHLYCETVILPSLVKNEEDQ